MDKTQIGTYLRLQDNTEVQILGFKLNPVTFEGTFIVRYTEKLLSGSSYEIPENQVYSASISKKFK